MRRKKDIFNQSSCQPTPEKSLSCAVSWNNKLQAKYLSASLCRWACRLAADTCNPAEQKQAKDGGRMTDAHCLWHHSTQAWRVDWQELRMSVRKNEAAACDDMSCSQASQTGASPIIIFHSSWRQKWSHLCHCPSALKQGRNYGTLPNTPHCHTHSFAGPPTHL